MTAPVTRGQRLAAEAREAAEVRTYQTDPDVVALRVEKARTVVEWFIWTGMVLGLLFTMSNVQQFAAHTTGAAPGSLGWWACWLLDPTVSLVLLGILLAERHISRHRVTVSDWTRVAKWGLLLATYVMNTWESYAAGSAAGIVLHSVPPLVVFMGAEAVTDLQDKLTECVHRAHAHAAARAGRKAAAQTPAAAQPPAATLPPPPPHQESSAGRPEIPAQPARPWVPLVPAPDPPTGPDRSGVAPAVGTPERPDLPVRTVRPDGPADRSADRSGLAIQTGPAGRPADRSGSTRADRSGSAARTGSGRKQNGRPRTDAQLSQEIRQLAEQDGRPPSAYQLKQRFGIGSDRAGRLLAQLAATTTPAGVPGHNSAARKEGTR